MIFLRSTLFNLCAFAWTFLLLIAYAPLLLLPRRLLVSGVRAWIRSIFFLQRHVLGLDFAFRGRERLPPHPFIIAAAHQSAWDTIGFYALFEDPVYILKKELIRAPLLGLYMRKLEMIAVDRRGGAGDARAMIRGVSGRLAEGRTVIIFPGGTRSPPDAAVPLKSGIGALYRRCDVPVVPVSLNSGIFWGRRSYLKKPGTIVVEFGEPIPPGLDNGTFRDMLSARIYEGNRRLVAEARQTAIP